MGRAEMRGAPVFFDNLAAGSCAVADQPCAYGLGVVFKENNQVAAYNAIEDQDIKRVAWGDTCENPHPDGAIQRRDPFPIDAGSSCRVPFFTTLPGFETAVGVIVPRSHSDWTSQSPPAFKFDGCYANGDEWFYEHDVMTFSGVAMPGLGPTLVSNMATPPQTISGTGNIACSFNFASAIVINAISVLEGGAVMEALSADLSVAIEGDYVVDAGLGNYEGVDMYEPDQPDNNIRSIYAKFSRPPNPGSESAELTITRIPEPDEINDAVFADNGQHTINVFKDGIVWLEGFGPQWAE